MACPCFCRATTWMSIIKTTATTALDNPVFAVTENNIKTHNLWEKKASVPSLNPKDEVNHRPAAQQWAVCTP